MKSARLNARLFFVLLAGGLLAGCATSRSPILYPNDQLSTGNQAAAQSHVDQCKAQALGAGLKATRGQRADPADVAYNVGAATAGGAARGAVYGHPGKGAAGSAAGTAASGLFRMAVPRPRPNPAYERYVNRCLVKRGYEVAGWQ